MRLKNVFQIAATLLVVLMFGCTKDITSLDSPMNTSSDLLTLKSGNASSKLTTPAKGDTGVVLNQVITVHFNDRITPAQIAKVSFRLNKATAVKEDDAEESHSRDRDHAKDSSSIAGTVAFTDSTATFTPAVNLEPNTVYTASVTSRSHEKDGRSKEKNCYNWNFTTGTGIGTGTGTGTGSAIGAVDLGLAGNYVILAKTAITNIATSAVTGDMGLSPAATSYITGFALTNATGYATASQVTGKVFAADMAVPTPINLTTAVSNMMTAYTDAAGRTTPDFTELGTGNIGGKTLAAGLYKWTTSVTIPTNVTISGGANDVWIFQISKDLIMSAGVKIILTGGAQAKNIFWQVAGQATLGTTSHFEGVILSMTGITFQTGASLNGRALAQTAVILDQNAVTQP